MTKSRVRRTIEWWLSHPTLFAIIVTFLVTEGPGFVGVFRHPELCKYDGIMAWPTAWAVCKIKGER